MKPEESQAMAALVSGSSRPLDNTSPPSERASSLQPHSSKDEPQVSGVEHAVVQHRDEADLSIARVNICSVSYLRRTEIHLFSKIFIFY